MFPKNERPWARRSTRKLVARVSCLTVLLAAPGAVLAAELSLADAEALALDQAPSLREVAARRDAMDELAVVSGQLPDPMVKVGAMSLPTDSWKLDREPMTQLQLGVVQKFPRGHTRALRAEQMHEQSAALDQTLADQRLRILLAVREDYIAVMQQRKLAAINEEAIEAFSDLSEITQDYYGTGRVQQQDVLRAAVELAKVEDRATKIAQDEERARARLQALIGEAAYQDLGGEWPDLAEPVPLDALQERLARHPRIAMLQQQVDAAETGIELADQRYKPEFGIDLTYGGRTGNNMDGSARSDLFSVMLTMDVPLFTKNRQDRYKAAAIAESSAAAFNRDDAWRRLGSEARAQAATLERQLERKKRFEEDLLPDAEFNAEAALSAYQASLENLTTLMRARITEYELQLEYATLRADLLRTRAQLLYLEGETS